MQTLFKDAAVKKFPLLLQLLIGVALVMPGLARSPWWLHEAIGSNWLMLLVVALVAVAGFRYSASLVSAFRLAVFATPNAIYYGLLFVVGTLLYAGVALLVFDAMPRITEGASSLFQAKIFADGKLWAEAGALHDTFRHQGMIHPAGHDTAYVTMLPPAWPAVLSFGAFFDLAWLVNPVLGGALVCAVGLLGVELHGHRTGRIAALLCLFSPMFLVLNGTTLGHTLPALCLVVCAWATIRLVRSGGVGHGVLAGLMMAVVILCRPASGLLVGLCIVVIPLCAFAGWQRFGKAVLVAGACAAIGVVGLMGWQHLVTGDWLTPGHAVMGEPPRLDFDESDVVPAVLGPAEAGANTRDRIGFGDDRLLGWPVSACLVLAALFFCRRARWWDAWCLLPVVALTGFLHFHLTDAYFFRARYLAEGVPFLFIPLARVFFIPNAVQRRWFVGAALACAAFALTVALPHQFSRYTPVYGDYLPHVLELEERFDVSHSVVFITAPPRWPNGEMARDLKKMEHGFHCQYYTAGFVRNRPDFNGDVVYVQHGVDMLALDVDYTQAERDELGLVRNLEIMSAYPQRRFFVLEFHRYSNEAKYYQVWPTTDFSGFEKVEEIGGSDQ